MPVCLVDGSVDAPSDVREADVLARGTLRMGYLDVVRQLLGASAAGGDTAEKARSLARFGGMFVGHLWTSTSARSSATRRFERGGAARGGMPTGAVARCCDC
jgi:hypothetical protein